MTTDGILLLTHSSRVTDLRHCARDVLIRRYAAPDRLDRLPAFESLPPMSSAHGVGSLSALRIRVDSLSSVRVDDLGFIRERHRPQQVAVVSEREWVVGYEDNAELWRLARPLPQLERLGPRAIQRERSYRHPHLPGIHTVMPLDADRVVLSSSGSDAVLVLDLRSGEVETTLRMPAEIYGHNYDLGPDMDLHRHYIGNDLQTTHINSASPMGDGSRVVVSTLIQGAIGIFDLASGGYREVTRGFVGCHGARVNDDGGIYFADSCGGGLVEIDEEGTVHRRFETGSRWLHDVLQIAGPIYAFTVADANELRLYNVETSQCVYRRRFFGFGKSYFYYLLPILRHWPGWRGNSTQFLSFARG